MVDKKQSGKKEGTSKEAPKKSIGKKETKTETFLRIAEPRVVKVLDTLRILGNCSNRTNYEYTSEQIDKMFNTISEVYEITLAKFSKSKTELINFKF